jgi:hypothetical protein
MNEGLYAEDEFHKRREKEKNRKIHPATYGTESRASSRIFLVPLNTAK